jgi:predicted  nucleic acid-binding Zn-ribbon protein
MSWVADILTAVQRVVTLEDRVARLDEGVDGLTAKLADTRDRVIRLEGLIEGALRTYRPGPTLPPPGH